MNDHPVWTNISHEVRIYIKPENFSSLKVTQIMFIILIQYIDNPIFAATAYGIFSFTKS
jgi:hypothetical protein